MLTFNYSAQFPLVIRELADSAPYHFNQNVNKSKNLVARMQHRAIRGIEVKKVMSAKTVLEMEATATRIPGMRKLCIMASR